MNRNSLGRDNVRITQKKALKARQRAISKDIIDEYLNHFKENYKRAWMRPVNQPIEYLAKCAEGEFVIECVFGLSREVIDRIERAALDEIKVQEGACE